MKYVVLQGFHKKNGVWAAFVGGLHPAVYIDAQVGLMEGGKGVVTHETVHGLGRHDLVGIFLLLIPPLYVWWRRKAEILADKKVLELHGFHELLHMVQLSPHPKTLWGKWLYGKTVRERIKRACA